MSRRFEQPYRCRQLRDLARQLRYAPMQRKAEQVRRAEQLHDEIDPDAMYPPQYLAYRITRHRAEHDDDTLLVGAAVRSDLRLVIDELSRSADLPPRPGEEILALDEWAAKLKVARKTLERWRKAGLRWRWFVSAPGGARRVGLTRVAVDRFTAASTPHAPPTTMTDAERDDAIAQARRLKAERPSLSLHRAAVALAGQRGRSVEAMRKLLEKRASDAFPERRGPLDARAKRLIARAIRMRVPVAQIAHRLGKSRHTIHRAALQHRAHLARQRRLDHVALPTFHREDADEVLLGHTLPLEPDPQRRAAIVEAGDLPPEVQPLYRAAAYADRTLHALFVRYNYVKFRAAAIREGFGRYQPRAGDLDRFESLAATADDLRSRIAHAQFPVVLSVVRRHLVGRPATASRVVELLKLGHGVLYEAIESYDPSRAQTFDAYLRNRLLRRLAGETDSEAARAHRRVDGPAVLREMQRQANEHGVTLTIPPISGTPGDAGD